MVSEVKMCEHRSSGMELILGVLVLASRPIAALTDTTLITNVRIIFQYKWVLPSFHTA